MWPFKPKNRSEERFIEKNFSKYTDKKKVDVVFNPHENPGLNLMHVDFVLILINQDSEETTTINNVISIVNAHDGMIESITCTLITVYFGVPEKQHNKKQLRLCLVDKLTEKLGKNLSIIHGECECPVGIVGNEDRKAYTALLPDYKIKLMELSSLLLPAFENPTNIIV